MRIISEYEMALGVEIPKAPMGLKVVEEIVGVWGVQRMPYRAGDTVRPGKKN